MKRILKWLAWSVAVLLVVVVAGVAYIAATVDPNDYKPQIVQLVKDQTGRTLTLNGAIVLRFFPRIGASIDDVTLSVPDGAQTFAKIGEARVALAVLPLLARRVVVDEVVLTGLHADLVKFKDGRTNFDDLLGAGTANSDGKDEDEEKSPSTDAGAPAIDVAGVTLRDAQLSWTDQTSGRVVRASDVKLQTGRIASDVPGKLKFAAHVESNMPKLALQVDATAGYRIDFDTRAATLSDFDVEVNGDAADLRALKLRVAGAAAGFDPAAARLDLEGVKATVQAGDTLDARVEIPQLLVSRERSQSKPLSAQLNYKTAERSLAAKLALSALDAQGGKIRFAQADVDVDLRQPDLALKGRVGTPLALDLDAQQLELAKLAGDFTVSGPQLPHKSAKLRVEGVQRVGWGAQTAHADLRVQLEDGTLHAKVDVQGFDAPAIRFDVDADRLDVDRYLPPSAPDQTASSAGAPAGKKGGSSDAAEGADKPIDLAWLKPLRMQGNLKVGQLVVSNLKAAQLRVGVQAVGGRLTLDPIAANLYQGTLRGNAVVNANSNSYAVRQQLTGISIGPLLRDLADKDLLEGRGNVTLDVQTAGTRVDALKRGLNGSAALALKDGALKGFNLAEALRKAKAVLGSKSAAEQLAKGGEQTDFSDLSASFRIRDGIARNDDLALQSPFLRVAGSGEVNIGESSMDYSVKASLVNTSTGQGGKTKTDVASLTVPVRIKGPLDRLGYRLDTRALIEGEAKNALQRALDKRLGGAETKPGAAAQNGGAADAKADKSKSKKESGKQLLRDLLK